MKGEESLGLLVPGRHVSAAGNTPVKRASNLDAKQEALVSKKLKMAKEFIPLEPYYYGSLVGDDNVLVGEFKADIAFKCHVCKKLF